MAHKIKESGGREPSSCLNPKLTRGAAPFPTNPRIPSTNARIGHQRNNLTYFTKETELFVVAVSVFCFLSFFFSSLVLPSSLSALFLYYNPLFSLPTTLSAPSHALSLHLHLLLLSFPNLSPYHSSLLHAHHLPTSLLYQLYTSPAPCNP
jgi:hypothetical protein